MNITTCLYLWIHTYIYIFNQCFPFYITYIYIFILLKRKGRPGLFYAVTCVVCLFFSWMSLCHFFEYISCLFSSTELIPKPAQPCDAPPLYLRLRMGKPLNRKGGMTTPIMSYGKKNMKPEYWFSIPRDKYIKIITLTIYYFLNPTSQQYYCSGRKT